VPEEGHIFPGGHGTQSSTALLPVDDEYLPASQGRGMDDPVNQTHVFQESKVETRITQKKFK
jgi:hypothetical protein